MKGKKNFRKFYRFIYFKNLYDELYNISNKYLKVWKLISYRFIALLFKEGNKYPRHATAIITKPTFLSRLRLRNWTIDKCAHSETRPSLSPLSLASDPHMYTHENNCFLSRAPLTVLITAAPRNNFELRSRTRARVQCVRPSDELKPSRDLDNGGRDLLGARRVQEG